MKVKLEIGPIQVESIESASGIFISQMNIVKGWHSQEKNNYGFGDFGDQNVIENCISIVSDDDFIDAPMNDNSIIIEKKLKPQNTNTDISLGDIQVETMDTNSSITIGDSLQTGWRSQSKINSGIGDFIGDNLTKNNRIFLYDNDIIDSPVKNVQTASVEKHKTE
ncbi:spore germination protein [Calidifontibacillus erzurumensis]|uniref:Spore germination protein n=1 Tax=Calidifontibacillus erzurumensis TaxID=2741433 RepID=A0A8J8GCC7_9BACI|nr:spore germination protein [Calidifontibacillus erzurumensis]NSL50924.1 spore germination protein [Calidifontibacillus erzurumensis]